MNSAEDVQDPDIVTIFNFSSEYDRDPYKDLRRQRCWAEIVHRLSGPTLSAAVDWKILDSERVALIVTCSDDALTLASREEGIREFINGGPSFLLPSVPPEKLTPATRCRLAFFLITSPKSQGGVGIRLGAGDRVETIGDAVGQADSIDASEFVYAIFPLMDTKFNQEWISSWAFKYTISTHELDKIRDIYGEEVAYYFAFEYFYFQWLIPIASLGTFAWVSGFGEYRGWWGFTVVLWAIAFSAFWSRRAKDLSHRWGTFHIPTTERPLPTYREDDPFLNPFTGNRVHVKLPRSFLDQVSVVLGVASGARAFEKFPLGTVLTTMLISFPAQLLGFVVLLIANAVVFTVDTWVNEYYDGPWKTVMTLLPLTAFLLTGPPLAAGLTLLARKLNGLENHTTNTVRDRDLTFKLFAWNGMAALFPVLFLIYVYIPFSGHVWWLGNPPRRERLKQFIILILVVNQLVDMLVENLLPRVLTALSKQAEVIQRKGMRKMLTTDGIGHLAASTIKKIKDEFLRETSGDPLLDRIRSEAFRETYDVFTDFSEMTVQFGNILLFAIAFPLAPLVGLVNNYFELRTDANKFCNSMRRPIPKRVPGTAAWEDAMAVLCFMATLTNATLVSYYATDDCAAPCTGPIRVEWGEVAAAVVVAQVCFLAARNVIHTFAESVPIDSIEEQAERERIKRADLVAAIAPEFGPVEPRCDVFLPKDLHDIRAIVDSHAVAAASEGLEEGGGGAPASAVDSSIVGDEEAERLIDGATSYGTFE